MSDIEHEIPGDTNPMEKGGSSVITEDAQQPVYEKNSDALLGRHLVMTPWMLLDRLIECQESAELLRGCILPSGGTRTPNCANHLSRSLDTLSAEIDHTLRVLWRGGLWFEGQIEERTALDGRVYHVLREPFTDGKSGGRPVPENIPNWQRELLGLPESDGE